MVYCATMSVPFRVATTDERASYEGVLYPLQDRILAVAATYGDALRNTAARVNAVIGAA
jgi:hypothetical protein